MRLVRSLQSMQRLACQWRATALRVGFVPTMGCLHAGHMSLVRHARRLVGPQGKVVVSIYVNPTQFGPREDFARYPRDLDRDARLCGATGVDVVFAPSDRDMYPDPHSTFVMDESLSRRMEGVSRPTHFRGVTTVVAKLFNLVQPAVAVFGAKDYQQAAIIKQMVRDLNFPVRIVVAPTVREADGLAMSSRNQYLEGDHRRQALVLWKAIRYARAAVRNNRSGTAQALGADLRKQIQREPDARVDYIEFFNPETLEPVEQAGPGTHMALAVYVGKTRLIDNARL